MLHYSTKTNSFMKEQNVYIMKLLLVKSFSDLVSSLELRNLAFPVSWRWCNRPATFNFWCCIFKKNPSLNLYLLLILNLNCFSRYLLSKQERSGVTSWAECELSGSWLQGKQSNKGREGKPHLTPETSLGEHNLTPDKRFRFY